MAIRASVSLVWHFLLFNYPIPPSPPLLPSSPPFLPPSPSFSLPTHTRTSSFPPHTHSLPLLLPPYLYSMHNSPVKCVEVYSNITKEVWQTISQVGKVQQEAIYRSSSKVSTRD